ncbi:hypothetical protein Cgig2_016624 [Carnegiea gigantea]|uniref:Uncharacterized protein n=1 Tax=Carnegiea gigantea TaxID=171969 RepID=A0A9Q1L031_9CARY|nr:hypothetical protein Cgig2_016624 [Carnegiea gigantea]
MVEIHPPRPTHLPPPLPPPPPPSPSPAMHNVNQSTRCGSCKVMETYMFWNEQPSATNKYHFPAYFSNSQPQVPQKFIYCFSGEPFGGCWSLRGLSGNEWRVKIERTEDDKAVFKEGRDVFMRDHDIDPNTSGTACFFVFSYAGNSTLDVLVMDTSGCVLESAYYATNSAGLPN